jgi:hypothetical protein
MTKWEYGYLWVQPGHRSLMALGSDEMQRLGMTDRQQVLATLNKLGADGWELASTETVHDSDATGHTVFWLRREAGSAQ